MATWSHWKFGEPGKSPVEVRKKSGRSTVTIDAKAYLPRASHDDSRVEFRCELSKRGPPLERFQQARRGR
jgi:hypothetical protein